MILLNLNLEEVKKKGNKLILDIISTPLLMRVSDLIKKL